ncbi:MAG: hypothetical protein MRY63_00880 [Neomegalonema sp.]|nr:hypothetical protein [Neomegalonema sp.]
MAADQASGGDGSRTFLIWGFFRAPITFSQAQFADDLKRRFPVLGEVGALGGPGEGEAVALTIDGHMGVAMAVPAPYPIAELQLEIALSRLTWPRSAPQDIETMLHAHKAHVACSVTASGNSIKELRHAAMLATMLAAVVFEHPDCLGVYLPSARLIAPVDRVQEGAEQAATGASPLALWLGLHPLMDQNLQTSAQLFKVQTHGLEFFTGREIDHEAAPVAPNMAINVTLGAAALLLDHGAIFNDNDTIGGEGGGPAYRIRHAVRVAYGTQVPSYLLLHPEAPYDPQTLQPTARLRSQTH